MDREAWEKRIDPLHDKALAAHEAGDGPTWRRVFNEVQALAETAYQEEFASMRLDDPAYIRRRTLGLTLRAQQVEQALAELVPSTTDEIRVMQLAEQKRLNQWLAETVTRPLRALAGDEPKEPAAARRSIEQLDAEIERIEAAVERLPSIGLVTDRGAG
jgi:molecular chaperone DnaK